MHLCGSPIARQVHEVPAVVDEEVVDAARLAYSRVVRTAAAHSNTMHSHVMLGFDGDSY
jgi:hypothetical protein